MAFGFRNPFKKAQPHAQHNDTPGQYGWGAPLQIHYKHRPLPPTDNNAQNAYQTYLSPRYTPIGPGIPNKRDFVDADIPMVAVQGILVYDVGSPGILAGQFGSGPLTNVSTDESGQPLPGVAGFNIPAA